VKITNVSVEFSSTAKKHAIRDAIQVLDRDGHCKLRIETDEGYVGLSDTYFGRVASSPAVLANIVGEQLGPAIIGEDPTLIRHIRDKLRKLTDYQGTEGLSMFGISAIDLALWDGSSSVRHGRLARTRHSRTPGGLREGDAPRFPRG
jgi:L-alanine-DL-glutamate epimerase-like enolase superfamily enzyme